MTTSPSVTSIDVRCDPYQLWALAQFCKRVSLATCRQHAQDDDEAYLMLYALTEIRSALAVAGIDPR